LELRREESTVKNAFTVGNQLIFGGWATVKFSVHYGIIVMIFQGATSRLKVMCVTTPGEMVDTLHNEPGKVKRNGGYKNIK
jgi:hypothetical protein